MFFEESEHTPAEGVLQFCMYVEKEMVNLTKSDPCINRTEIAHAEAGVRHTHTLAGGSGEPRASTTASGEDNMAYLCPGHLCMDKTEHSSHGEDNMAYLCPGHLRMDRIEDSS